MVFRQFGVSLGELATQAGIKAARNRLMMANHSDHTRGGDERATKLNVAYDVLKRLPSGYFETPLVVHETAERPVLPGGFYDRRPRGDTGLPAWQTDRTCTQNRVERDDYRDLNYIKKRMWELSFHSRDEYLVYYYDGTLRSPIAVFGAPEIFAEMAAAVKAWVGPSRGFGHRAVFVQRARDAGFLLIQLNGRTLASPVPFGHDCLCADPTQDPAFLRSLPLLLDRIARKQQSLA